jgi:preprotein translocase subunit SecY
MPFCPNPDCPHRKATKKPAEFQSGITLCSDCGSPLVESFREEVQKRRIALTDLHRKILLTIGLLLVWRVLALIPVPGVNLQVSKSFIEHSSGGFLETIPRLSVMALGIMPYISAYMIVEIFSLFVPPLKSWRDQGYQGRMKLRKVALLLTLVLTIIQGYGVALGLEDMVSFNGVSIVLTPGFTFRSVSTLTLTAGAFLTVWITDLITKKGVGHGISILILAGYGAHLFLDFPKIALPAGGRSLIEYVVLYGTLAIIAIGLIVIMEKGYRKVTVRYEDGTEAFIPLKFTSAGITPAEWASTVIFAPVSIIGLFDLSAAFKFNEIFGPGSALYFFSHIVLILFLYYFFTSFFYHPARIMALVNKRQGSILPPDGREGTRYIDRSLEFMIPFGAAYLCAFYLAPSALVGLLGFYFPGLSAITAVAVLLDLMGEVPFRKRSDRLVKIAELHDVPIAGLVKSLLDRKGIPCFLRGYYHRALLYFFGPYIEISVLVPEVLADEARAAIIRYVDGRLIIPAGNVRGRLAEDEASASLQGVENLKGASGE